MLSAFSLGHQDLQDWVDLVYGMLSVHFMITIFTGKHVFSKCVYIINSKKILKMFLINSFVCLLFFFLQEIPKLCVVPAIATTQPGLVTSPIKLIVMSQADAQ